MDKFVICSGGTGGHMFPACALCDELASNGYDVELVTDERGSVFAKRISNKTVLKTIRFSFFSIIHLIGIIFILFRRWIFNRPAIIVGFGGLMTVAPIIIAKILGAKVVIYEQNAMIGKANKLLSHISNLNVSMFLLSDKKQWVKQLSPVRKEVMKFRDVKYCCDNLVNILSVGGSQGARSFSSIIPEAISKLSDEFKKCITITQQVAYGDIGNVESAYKDIGVEYNLLNFIDNIGEMMANAQLVICRAGSSTIAELLCIGRPAIFIPYPKATDNHQFFNANYLQNIGAAWVVKEDDNTSDSLSQTICEILKNRELLKLAASNIVDCSIVNSSMDFMKLIVGVLKK